MLLSDTTLMLESFLPKFWMMLCSCFKLCTGRTYRCQKIMQGKERRHKVMFMLRHNTWRKHKKKAQDSQQKAAAH